jgi:hypothetical protein
MAMIASRLSVRLMNAKKSNGYARGFGSACGDASRAAELQML